jgi:hypothetical protein
MIAKSIIKTAIVSGIFYPTLRCVLINSTTYIAVLNPTTAVFDYIERKTKGGFNENFIYSVILHLSLTACDNVSPNGNVESYIVGKLNGEDR